MLQKFIVSLSVWVLFSCSSFIDPDLGKLETSSFWATDVPSIKSISKLKKTVYISIRNISGVSIDVKEDLIGRIRGRGYKITTNVDEASLSFLITIKKIAHRAKASGSNKKAGKLIGAVAGGIAGGDHDEALGGAVAGAVLGGVVGGIVDNRDKIREYILLADINFGQRQAKKVNYQDSELVIRVKKVELTLAEASEALSRRFVSTLSEVLPQ